MVPCGFYGYRRKGQYKSGYFFKYVDGNMRRWTPKLRNLCYGSQMLSSNVQSYGIDGYNGILSGDIVKRVLADSHKHIRSDTGGQGIAFQGTKESPRELGFGPLTFQLSQL